MIVDRTADRFRRVAAALIGLALPLVARAAQDSAKPASMQPPVGAADVLGFGASLAIVIAAVLVVGWLYARGHGIRRGDSSVINILAAQPLGSKERIVLVEVGGKQIVLGMTAAQVRTLHVFDEPVVETSPSAASGFAFADRLRAALRGVVR